MTKKATEAQEWRERRERDVRNSWVVHIYLGTTDIVPSLEMLYLYIFWKRRSFHLEGITLKRPLL